MTTIAASLPLRVPMPLQAFRRDGIMMSSSGACCWALKVSRSPLVPCPAAAHRHLEAIAGSKNIATRMSPTGCRRGASLSAVSAPLA
jgi:hypothetical protein